MLKIPLAPQRKGLTKKIISLVDAWPASAVHLIVIDHEGGIGQRTGRIGARTGSAGSKSGGLQRGAKLPRGGKQALHIRAEGHLAVLRERRTETATHAAISTQMDQRCGFQAASSACHFASLTGSRGARRVSASPCTLAASFSFPIPGHAGLDLEDVDAWLRCRHRLHRCCHGRYIVPVPLGHAREDDEILDWLLFRRMKKAKRHVAFARPC